MTKQVVQAHKIKYKISQYALKQIKDKEER